MVVFVVLPHSYLTMEQWNFNNGLTMEKVTYMSVLTTDRLLMNQNKSGKLKTYKTYQKESIISTTDIYVRRLLKDQEPIF